MQVVPRIAGARVVSEGVETGVLTAVVLPTALRTLVHVCTHRRTTESPPTAQIYFVLFFLLLFYLFIYFFYEHDAICILVFSFVACGLFYRLKKRRLLFCLNELFRSFAGICFDMFC